MSGGFSMGAINYLSLGGFAGLCDKFTDWVPHLLCRFFDTIGACRLAY